MNYGVILLIMLVLLAIGIVVYSLRVKEAILYQIRVFMPNYHLTKNRKKMKKPKVKKVEEVTPC